MISVTRIAISTVNICIISKCAVHIICYVEWRVKKLWVSRLVFSNNNQIRIFCEYGQTVICRRQEENEWTDLLIRVVDDFMN